MSDCRFGVSPVNYPDPDPDPDDAELLWHLLLPNITNEPPHDKTNIMTCAQRRLRSACASTQSDQSLCCALSGELMTQAFFMRTVKTLIRLGGCPG